MKNRVSVMLVSGALALMLSGSAVVAQNNANNNNQVTQGELALMLINMLGLQQEIEVTGSPLDAIRVLLIYGISPINGWEVDRPVVLGDLAVVLVQSLQAQDEVDDPNDPVQCIAYLEGLGVPMDTVSGAVLIVPPRGDEIGGTAWIEMRDDSIPGTDGEQRPLTPAEIRNLRTVTLPEIRDIIRRVPSVPPPPPFVTPD